MTDLATMMREQLSSNLNAQLDSAVTAGDIAAARKASDSLSKLAATTAPAGPVVKFTAADIRKELEAKAPWFGIDPRRSSKVLEYGKMMDSNRFDNAAKFAEALIAAIDEEFPPAGGRRQEAGDAGGDGDNDDAGGDDAGGDDAPVKPARKKTDAPSAGDAGAARRNNGSGPWAKLSDAPANVRDDINRTLDKYCRNGTKEQREQFTKDALATHYAAHQRKGK
jgi:hypothetical protein